jgi:hypothetical protein
MGRFPIGAALAGVVMVGGLLAAPTPALAAGSTTRIALTVQKQDHTGSTAWLGCSPARGTHTSPKAACAALAKARGNIAALPEEQGMCSAVYSPVTAAASGRWRGRVVRYRQTFGNECEMHLKTDVLFRI